MDWSSQWTCLLPVSQWFKLIWDLFSLHRLLKSNCFITQHDDTQHTHLSTVTWLTSDLSEVSRWSDCRRLRRLVPTSAVASEVSQWRRRAALKLIGEESNAFYWGSEGFSGQLGSLGMMGRILCCRCCCGISGGRGHQLGGSGCFSYLAGPPHMGGTMRPAIAERRPDKHVHISSTETNSSMC